LASDDEFYRLRTGQMIYYGDPDYTYKMMVHGELVPNSPLQKAEIILAQAKRLLQRASHDVFGGSSFRKKASALQNEAKSIYFDLLRHKESVPVHQMLAPLLTAGEAERMAAQYKKYPGIKEIYKERLRTLGFTPEHRIGRWLWPILLLLALFVLLGLLLIRLASGMTSSIGTGMLSNTDTSTNTSTRVTQEYVNDMTYIDELPNIHFDNSVSVHATAPVDIATEIDNANLSVHATYLIQGSQGPDGYAINEGNGHFMIRLLNGAQGVIPAMITPYQLNLARTAYAYYLSAHNDVPPKSLNPIQSMVPEQVPMNQIEYHSSASPERALTIPGQSVPFQTPDIEVDLAKRRIALVYNHQPLVQAPAGVGSGAEPTPTGSFTVTDRIPNHAAPVYGDYIFPLNHSSFAIHGTNAPGRVGKNQSLGCVEVTNAVSDQLFSLVPVGTPVIISDNHVSGTQSPSIFR
jgi:lipoprotein-anchoring transpeptidase ErfK/SrfK